jgi:hypothetical protein
VSCKSVIITRTQIGHKDTQEHSFSCPKCGVKITYLIDLDQKRGKSNFRKPVNAKWATSEQDAIATLTFSDEIPLPVDMGQMFSPFLATVWNIEDLDKYRRDETLRQIFINQDFRYAERCSVHFERKAWDLFDKESPSHSKQPQTIESRLIDLYNAYTAGFWKFTLNTRGRQYWNSYPGVVPLPYARIDRIKDALSSLVVAHASVGIGLIAITQLRLRERNLP